MTPAQSRPPVVGEFSDQRIGERIDDKRDGNREADQRSADA
jgi:hypothetical protein